MVEESHLRPEDYDADLVAELRARLGLPRRGTLETALAGLPAQDLVRCLLAIAEPYAEMLRALLALYAAVGARSSDGDNLRLRFDFGDGDPLDLLLQKFREQVEIAVRVTATREERVWTVDALWTLDAQLRDHVEQTDVTDDSMAAWRRIYEEGAWPSSLPRPSDTGSTEADQTVNDCLAVVSGFIYSVSEVSGDREELKRWRNWVDEEQPAELRRTNLRDLAWADSDGWPLVFLENTFRLADAVREAVAADAADAAQARQLASDASAAIRDCIHGQQSVSVTVEEDIKKLIDLLSLPVWGKRHEMYSAWVLTEIVEAVGLDRVTVHVADGVLEFSFSGSHIGTITTLAGPAALWAELRSPYAKPIGKGRSKAIQPDYRVSLPPITSPSGAVLAVECKQHKKSRRKELAHVLADYTGGLPNALVVIASYGKVSGQAMDGLDDDQRIRAAVVSDLRRNSGVSSAAFRSLVADALLPPAPVVHAPIIIGLSWPDLETDLDLYARIRWADGSSQVVWFDEPGDRGVSRAWLDEDVRHGGGKPETITVTQPAEEIDILVNAFGPPLGIAGAGAVVEVRMQALGITLKCPPPVPDEEQARCWHVATIRRTVVDVVGHLYDDLLDYCTLHG
jgi:hypothetical protein